MKWKIKSKAPDKFFKQFPEYSPLITQLFYNRGLKTQQQIDEFFNPDYQTDIYDPFLLKGMKKATERITKAIAQQEKIVIYGDYDADGVCSSAILFLTLKELGHNNLQVYIPDRVKEGYGLNKEAVKWLLKEGTKLIITVDCGCVDLEETDLANSLGIDIVITDHHQLKDKLPKAVALINPWQKNDRYPFKQLAGAGVAYKLACALLSKLKNRLPVSSNLEKWLLDLVAIATVADVMPIIGENRTLVKYGLGVLAQTKWLGLKELMKIAKITPQVTRTSLKGEAPVTNLNTYTLGYVLGPRLNAAGRMNHANTAFQLLVAQNKKEAMDLAQQLNQSNLSRQNLTGKIVREIEDRLEEKFSQRETLKLIFEGSPDWPVGLIGLLAGRIKDKYGRPTIIYQENGSVIRASCRSVPQLNLIKMMEKSADLLDDFGGHKVSAGFETKKEKLDKVKNLFSQITEKALKNKDLTPILDIDVELSLGEINWSNYDQVQSFNPFGVINPEPRFLAKEVEITGLREVGNNGQHLKMELAMFDNQSNQAKNFKAIGFGLVKQANEFKKGDLIDVVFELINNEWNGHRELEMKVIDFKKIKP